MTKFQKLFKDIEDMTDEISVFPKAYTCAPSKTLKKSKGYDRTQDGGVRNEYGEGWNDATMKIFNLIGEVLDKYYKNKETKGTGEW